MEREEEIKWMKEALAQANLAAEAGEVPVGAVVVCGGVVISRAHNEVEKRLDACAHAEILAIQRASSALGSWRLDDASLFVTLEPCTMCVGAAISARLGRLYFGCFDERQGAAGSRFDLSRIPGLAKEIEVYPGLLEEQCGQVLSNFFDNLRA